MLKQKITAIFLYFILVGSILLPSRVIAEINIQKPQNMYINIQQFTYPRNLAVSKIIPPPVTATTSLSIYYGWLLSVCNNISLEINLTLIPDLKPLQNINSDLYSENTIFVFNQSDAIGYMFDFNIGGNTKAVTENNTKINIPSVNTYLNLGYCKLNTNISLTVSPVILKPLANITNNNTIPNIASVEIEASRRILGGQQSEKTSFNVSMTTPKIINKPYTCTLNNQNQTVNLEPISVTDLLSGRAANFKAGQFTLQLNCPGDNNPIFAGVSVIKLNDIYATMFDNNARDSNDSDILTLLTNGERNPSVGLRLIRTDNNQIIKYGIHNQWLFATDAHGTQPRVSFDVKYVPLQTPILPGDVTGTATITFSYQ